MSRSELNDVSPSGGGGSTSSNLAARARRPVQAPGASPGIRLRISSMKAVTVVSPYMELNLPGDISMRSRNPLGPLSIL